MLRLFQKNYPIRNLFFIKGEGLSIFVSVLISTWMLSDTRVLLLTNDLLLKTVLITFVCQMCLYYNDLYDLKITIGFQELSIRLLQALGVASIVLAFVYFIFPTSIKISGHRQARSQIPATPNAD